MHIIDLIVIVILVWCLWSGWKNGILTQLGGIVGIVVGAWVAYKFSHVIGGWLDMEELPTEVLFIVVLLAVMICVIVLCRLITKVFQAGGLAFPLRLLGAAFAVMKGILLLSLALLAFEAVMPWVRALSDDPSDDKKGLPSQVTEAKSYRLIKSVGDFVFPYIAEGTQALIREVRGIRNEAAPVETAVPATPTVLPAEPATVEAPSAPQPDSVTVQSAPATPAAPKRPAPSKPSSNGKDSHKQFLKRGA